MCADRWTRDYYFGTQRIFLPSGEQPEIPECPECVLLSIQVNKKALSGNQKYRRAHEIAKTLPSLVAEVGTKKYLQRLKVLVDLQKSWENNEEVNTVKVNNKLSNNYNDYDDDDDHQHAIYDSDDSSCNDEGNDKNVSDDDIKDNSSINDNGSDAHGNSDGINNSDGDDNDNTGGDDNIQRKSIHQDQKLSVIPQHNEERNNTKKFRRLNVISDDEETMQACCSTNKFNSDSNGQFCLKENVPTDNIINTKHPSSETNSYMTINSSLNLSEMKKK